MQAVLETEENLSLDALVEKVIQEVKELREMSAEFSSLKEKYRVADEDRKDKVKKVSKLRKVSKEQADKLKSLETTTKQLNAKEDELFQVNRKLQQETKEKENALTLIKAATDKANEFKQELANKDEECKILREKSESIEQEQGIGMSEDSAYLRALNQLILALSEKSGVADRMGIAIIETLTRRYTLSPLHTKLIKSYIVLQILFVLKKI